MSAADVEAVLAIIGAAVVVMFLWACLFLINGGRNGE